MDVHSGAETGAARQHARAAFQALPPRERVELARAAARGQRGINAGDAAYMLWCSQNELRRGPWPGVRVALIVGVAVFINYALAAELGGDDLAALVPWLGLIPAVAVIPLVAWARRRPHLQRAAQLNAAVLAGHPFDGPPDPEAAERLLALALREGWLRGTHHTGS